MLKLKIILNSRHGNNYLQRVENTQNKKWVLKSSSDIFKVEEDDTGKIIAIDPVGGPMLSLGQKIKGFGNKTIKSITFFKNIGYVIAL